MDSIIQIVLTDSECDDYDVINNFIASLYLEENPNATNMNLVEVKGKRKKLVYHIPLDTEITINYKGNKITCMRSYASRDHSVMGSIQYLRELKIKGPNKGIINEMILESCTLSEKAKIYSYDSKHKSWRKKGNVPERTMDTLIISDDAKKIFEDLKKFLDPNEEKEYIKYGQRYKKTYIFHGNPGTGKSSLVNAIAWMFRRNIYIINMDPRITDSIFESAIDTINDKNALLLLEDIDASFQKRDMTKNITHSTLLNILDGVSSISGLVTIITTNFINNLDQALLRPGRINMMVKFTEITRQQLKHLFELYNITISDNCCDIIYGICTKNKLVTSVISEFLFRFKDADMGKIHLHDEFKKYMIEIEPYCKHNKDNAMYS